MKNYINLLCLTVMILLLNKPAEANWIRSNYDGNEIYDDYDKKVSIGDSLPAGVTKEWLNSLTDENGQKISQSEEPEGDAMQERFFTGFAASDQFGYSVSSAGDVNGDGYSDIIIGAPFNDAGGSNAGRAYIYFGGSIINSGVDVILTGLAAGDQFGFTVSTAGDVNGDGYSDVLSGAPLNDAIGSNSGRAYIYFGGSTMNNVADVIFTGAASEDQFGYSVSTAGDINGDGYNDVISGAILNDAGGSNAGRAYVYFGGSTMNNVSDVTLTGLAVSDQFGFSVSSAGDFNGDGYGDVISGANLNDGGGANSGRAYIYFGAGIPDNSADVILTGAASNDQFGYSVSYAGDVNGDGYSEVIVGAPFNDDGSADAGKAYVYFGGSVPDNTADVAFTGAVAGDQFGTSVSSAGDINGDGFTEVIAGANLYDVGGLHTGRAYVYFGAANSEMDNAADVILTGIAAGDQFGFSVSSAGDMNGDGYSDLMSGAILNDAGGLSAGRVYIYLNSMTGTDIADEFFTAESAGDEFGFSISSAGDINGDGFSDIIIGADENNAGAINAGRVYIYFGGIIQDNIADLTITGAATNDNFGGSVSSAGDVNGDSFSDVIVGAAFNNSNGADAGRAYVYYGGNIPDTIADVILNGAVTADQFGSSVSSAGDVNGDGYSDVVVGAPYSDGAGINSGRAYIFFGGSLMNNIADITCIGEASSDNLGIAVSTAGDFNGDGFSDVIAGAHTNDAGGANAGRAYIFFGGTVPDSIADVILTGEDSGDQFGQSLSGAGDVNGDGFSDVIVGAWVNNAGGDFAGRSYIYFGGIVSDTIADVTFTGEAAGNGFGYSVSSAGDVNGDGFSDVIVGAPFSNAGGTNSGRAYIFFGGNSMNNIADVTMTGSAAGDVYGYSVSSAGDRNNDSYSDVITGSPGNDAGGTDAGRVYLYLSSAPSVKPILNTVKDVPNDQGGKVYLRWARSGYDIQSIGTITDYVVQRSYPPSGGNYSWENIAYIPATNELFYAYTADTPFDSISNNSGTLYFRITARTSISTQYWRSNILFGRSIDNIAPLMVSPFNAISESSNIRLIWKKNTEPDLYNYILYRSTSATIDPETETPYATLTDSTYLDTAPLSGANYYFIVAQDIHGNYSPVGITQSPNITLNMTMFIEGFYNSSTDLQVSDTIKVYLRNTVTPFAKIDSAKAVVSANGSASLLFGNAPTGQYYIVTTHRNSLETWSKSGGESLVRGSAVNYNFSTASSQAYGSNMKQVDTSPARFADFSGDVNQDGFINLADVIGIYNDAGNFVTGYKVTDTNGDNITDLSDILIANNNSVGFVTVVKP